MTFTTIAIPTSGLEFLENLTLKSPSAPEMLILLKRPDMAIGFAVEHLLPEEVKEFLRDWQQDKDLASWVNAWDHDRRTTAGEDPETHRYLIVTWR